MAGLLNTSPVAAPSSLTETLAEKLKRIAEEAKAGQQQVADSGSASPGNRGLAASLPQRNSTGGITTSRGIPNVAMGSAEGAEPAAIPAGIAAPAPEPAPAMGDKPLPVGVASPESLSAGLAPKQGRPPLPAPPQVMGATPGYANTQQPAQGSALPPAPPAPGEPPAPTLGKQLSAREEAEAKVGKRTGWNKLGIALSAAAETIGGLPAAGGMNRGLTARAVGAHEAKIQREESAIQKERDRLQGELDKDIARKRLDRAEGREEKELDGRLRQIDAQIAATKDKNEIDKLELQARERKDQLNHELKVATLEQKRQEAARKGVTLQPGTTYNVFNPATGEWVVAIENDNAMVTTTQNSEVATATDPTTGKPITVRKDTTNTQTKGPRGRDGTVNAATPQGAEAAFSKAIQALAEAGGDPTKLTPPVQDYLRRKGVIK